MANFLQAQINLDSLWGVWNDKTVPDSCRAQAMIKISWDGYVFSKPDSAFYFAQMLFDFANGKGLKKEMARAKRIQGVSCFLRSDYPKALEYYQTSLTLCEEISDKSGMASNLNNIGAIYSNKGYYPEALNFYQRCIKIREEISDKKGMASVLNNIGNIYTNNGDYPKALDYYQRCIKIREEISDKSGMAIVLNNIGNIYTYSLNYPKAMEYYQQSLTIVEDLQDKTGVASTLHNIGKVYQDQGDYTRAMDYYQRSLRIKEEISDSRGMVNTLNNLGRIYYMQGNYIKAIGCCEKALSISEEINILEGQKHACEYLYYAYKAIGNNHKALNYHERVTILDDSLQAAETTKMLQQMEFARQMLKDSLLRDEEKLRIQLVNEAEVKKKVQTRNVFLVVAVILLMSAVSIYRRVHFARKSKKAIQKEKERSDNLLHNILPAKIAEELKLKGKAKAKNFKEVTIIFSNFKGFSKISEKLSAEELVEEINSCFEPFDQICHKYGIDKIKTIGDSYMAAGGLPIPSEDAVRRTVLAGLEMMEFIDVLKKEKESKCELCFEMRVGIHTGPVIAGIVGASKFQYDIWGDAVNTASRMEDAGEVGKVNISQTTYELIKDDPEFRFERRGNIRTKGKGEIEMWFVKKVGQHESPS
jgi:class 3 adenylate cyclase/Tfp pilus assembly protein PilF